MDGDKILTEKYKSVFKPIKNNDGKYEIDTELLKSGTEDFSNDRGKSELVIEEAKIEMKVLSILANLNG